MKIISLSVHVCLTILTLLVLVFSLYLQYQVGLHPCPLCLMQRACVVLLLVILIAGFLFPNKEKSFTYALLVLSGAGLFFSLRQLWLQALPVGHIPACLPGLDVLLQYFPWQTVVKALFWGSGDCSEITWTLLGLSLSAWSTLYFLFVLVFSLLGLFSSKNTANSL